MNRRTFLGMTAGAGAVAARISGSAAAQRGSDRERPNILYIIPHDLGPTLGCYGHPDVKTPNLDRLAAGGVRFSNHFCASTACSPSRGTLMTGRYAHSNGLMGLVNRNWSLPENEQTIVDHLNEAGYETVHAGLQHERTKREMNRYRTYLGTQPGKDRFCDAACAQVIEWLKGRAPGDGPFYLNAGFFECHAPWEREEYLNRYDPDAVTVPPHLNDVPGMRRNLAAFLGSVSFMDEWVGRVLDALREAALEENTIVVFTTDHGISFPRAKGTLYDPGMRTPMITRWPGGVRGGTEPDELVHGVDLVPSLLDLLGLPIPEAVQGRSFAPLLTGGEYQPAKEIFFERNFHDYIDIVRAVRTRRFKYIRNLTERNRPMMPSDDPTEHRWNVLRDSGVPRPLEELYDLEADPNEFTNLAEDPAHADTLADLRGRLDRWMDETADPFRGATDFIHSPQRDVIYRNLAEPPE